MTSTKPQVVEFQTFNFVRTETIDGDKCVVEFDDGIFHKSQFHFRRSINNFINGYLPLRNYEIKTDSKNRVDTLDPKKNPDNTQLFLWNARPQLLRDSVAISRQIKSLL